MVVIQASVNPQTSLCLFHKCFIFDTVTPSLRWTHTFLSEVPVRSVAYIWSVFTFLCCCDFLKMTSLQCSFPSTYVPLKTGQGRSILFLFLPQSHTLCRCQRVTRCNVSACVCWPWKPQQAFPTLKDIKKKNWQRKYQSLYIYSIYYSNRNLKLFYKCREP